MVTIDNIKASLDSNKALTPDVKRNIFELAIIFNQKFPGIDLTNLDNRLKTLTIRQESKYLVKLACQYKPQLNEIMVNKELLNSSSNMKHVLMHQILSIITAKDNYSGFNNSEDTLLALNEGYTEILTNFLVGDIDNNIFMGDIIIANLVSKIIGDDILLNSYFNNDCNSVINAMKKVEVQ